MVSSVLFGHHQPIPMSEVVFPSIWTKLSNTDENWEVPLSRDLNLLLSSICSSPLALGRYQFALFGRLNSAAY